jgi:hypothetical protein
MDWKSNTARPVFRMLAFIHGATMLLVGMMQIQYRGWASIEFLIPGTSLILVAITGKLFV